jgi:Plasmid replication region DNA-binding N-term.
MASTSITQEEAFAAIEQLYARGEHPTHLKLRSILNKGSGPTLSAFLDEWASKRGAYVANAVAAGVLAQPVEEAEQRLRKAAEDAAEMMAAAETRRRAELQARENALDERDAMLARREADLEQQERRLQDREAEQARLIAELKADKERLDSNLRTANSAAAAAAEDARNERQRLIDERLVAQQRVDVLTSRLEEMTRQSATDRADIARLSARLLELEQQAADLRRERDLAAQDRQRTITELSDQLASALATANALRADLSAAHQQLQALGAEAAAAQAQAAEIRLERDRLAGELAAELAAGVREVAQIGQRLEQLQQAQAAHRADTERPIREATQTLVAEVRAAIATAANAHQTPVEQPAR